MMDGTVNEPPCPHCLSGPCIIRRPPVFLSGRAVPSLANDRKRYVQTISAILAGIERPGVVEPSNIPDEEGIGDTPFR